MSATILVHSAVQKRFKAFVEKTPNVMVQWRDSFGAIVFGLVGGSRFKQLLIHQVRHARPASASLISRTSFRPAVRHARGPASLRTSSSSTD